MPRACAARFAPTSRPTMWKSCATSRRSSPSRTSRTTPSTFGATRDSSCRCWSVVAFAGNCSSYPARRRRCMASFARPARQRPWCSMPTTMVSRWIPRSGSPRHGRRRSARAWAGRSFRCRRSPDRCKVSHVCMRVQRATTRVPSSRSCRRWTRSAHPASRRA